MNVMLLLYKRIMAPIKVIRILLLATILPSACLALSLADQQQLQAVISDRNEQIEQLRERQTGLQDLIHEAENQLQVLDATPMAEKTFEVKNSAIGLKYDIQSWRETLKALQLEINNLQRANNLDVKILQQGQGDGEVVIENTPNVLDILETDMQDAVVSSGVDMKEIREKQQALVKDSYRLSPGAAAVNLAKARALEPMATKPVLGEQSVLISEMQQPDLKQFVGVMEHMGGNQYYLEAILKPGLQDFVIGRYRISRVVPKEYAAVLSIVLLDVSRPDQPSLQFFVK